MTEKPCQNCQMESGRKEEFYDDKNSYKDLWANIILNFEDFKKWWISLRESLFQMADGPNCNIKSFSWVFLCK